MQQIVFVRANNTISASLSASPWSVYYEQVLQMKLKR